MQFSTCVSAELHNNWQTGIYKQAFLWREAVISMLFSLQWTALPPPEYNHSMYLLLQHCWWHPIQHYNTEMLIWLDMICTGSSPSNALSGPWMVRVLIPDKNLYLAIDSDCVTMNNILQDILIKYLSGSSCLQTCSTSTEKCFLVGKHFLAGSSQKMHHTCLFHLP